MITAASTDGDVENELLRLDYDPLAPWLQYIRAVQDRIPNDQLVNNDHLVESR